MRKMSYLNAVLTALAVLLALNLLVVLGDSKWPGAASAQPAGKESVLTPPFNSAEDRKTLINNLETANSRLAAIEARLERGLNVVVTKMPPISIADKKDDKREPNPDTRIEVKKDGQK